MFIKDIAKLDGCEVGDFDFPSCTFCTRFHSISSVGLDNG